MQIKEAAPVLIRIAHSPDPDDRFMFWPLREGLIPQDRFRFAWSCADTQALNELASQGQVELCAVSAAHFVALADRYLPMKMGSSVGRNYGPVLVAPAANASPRPGRDALSASRAVLHALTPGPQTTAQLVLNLLCGRFGEEERVPIVPMRLVFERLAELVQEGLQSVALLIHEGRLTYQQQGCRLLLDLGQEWHKATGGLPLPLGINVLRSDLPAEIRAELAALCRQSFLYAREHRQAYAHLATDPASPYFSPLSTEALLEYLDLYANESTLEPAADERLAFSVLLAASAMRATRWEDGPLTEAEWKTVLAQASDTLEWV